MTVLDSDSRAPSCWERSWYGEVQSKLAEDRGGY
jgi:hypothetical protein